MPLYNAEKYLREALQSVLNQTYQDFELICIDDASDDSTMEILQYFQHQDNRIKIMSNKERFGAAISRNRGIEASVGKYITFLDGDDIFEEEMLQLAYQAIEKNNVDIVMYEYKHVQSEYIYEKKSVLRSPQFIRKYCKVPFSMQDCTPIEFLNWSSSPWNKLYRKSFIISNQLEFQTLTSSNDVFFVEMALLLAKKMIMLDDRRVMVYARDHFEPSRISIDRDPMCVYWAMEKIGNELVQRKLLHNFSDYYYCLLFFYLRTAILRTKKKENANLFYNFLKQEGVKALLDLDKKGFEQGDSYICNLLEQFQKQEYSAEWYKKETILAFYLNKQSEKLQSLFRTFEERHIQSALWGAGDNGKVLLDFLQSYNLKVAEVVDMDKGKQGQLLYGYEVKKPDEIWDKVQVILVTNYAMYMEILAEAKEKKIKVVNIGEIVGRD